MARKSISTNTTTSLGDSGQGSVTTKVLQVTGTAWSAGTLTIMGRLQGSNNAWVPIPYRKRYLNGAVADESFVSTALTGDSLIEVNAAGIEVAVVSAGLTATKIDVDSVDLMG